MALQRSKSNRQGKFAAAAARMRIASLTPREREIVRLVVAGLLNKEIADQLDLALITVKVHRGRAMHKLAAGNPAEMVHIAQLGMGRACPIGGSDAVARCEGEKTSHGRQVTSEVQFPGAKTTLKQRPRASTVTAFGG